MKSETKKLRAVGYCRVSTTGQAEEGVSLAAQREKIQAWADLNDYELIEVYEDAGLSGGRADNRDGLQEALSAACKQNAAFVIYSISRMSRSTKDTLAIADRLQKAGADLVSLSEQIDTTNAAGKMVFRMLAVMAEFERDLVSERTKIALSHKKALGQRVGTVPFGYRLAGDGCSLVEDEPEQKLLEEMRDLRKKGLTLQAIADRFNQRGHKTRRGSQWRKQYIGNLVSCAA